MSTKKHKYNAKKVETHEGRFDSKGEWRRWCYLKDLEKRGIIKDLTRQVEFSIDINDKHIFKYKADAQYSYNGVTITEDYKGMVTAIFRLKKKLMLAILGIDVKIVKEPSLHPKDF